MYKKQKHLRFTLFIFGLLLFVLNACKKSEDNPNDGGIAPMYGVKEKKFKQPSPDTSVVVNQNFINKKIK